MIDNKLQFYQTRAGYDAQKNAGNIPNDALVFVKDTHEIITHGEEDFGNSDKYGDIAYLGDQAGTAVTPEFNPQDDTVWTKDQVLSDDKKDAAQANIFNKVAGDGMGKVVLKKNMVSGVNTLTQDMFYKTEGNVRVPNTDTIFVIKYDYVLGEDVTIPANCVLEFDGGSISASGSNDTITGANTSISAGLVKIFNTNITLAGTWNVAEAYPEWFGAVKNDSTVDCRDAIQKTLDSFQHIRLQIGTYYILSANSDGYGIVMPVNGSIKGYSLPINIGNYYPTMSTISSFGTSINIKLIALSYSNRLENIFIRGNGKTGTNIGVTHNPDIELNRYHVLENVQITDCYSGIDLISYGCTFRTVSVYYCYNGIKVSAASASVSNTSCIFEKCSAYCCSTYGFKLYNMVYCSFVSSSCDFIGYSDDTTPVSDVSIVEGAYVFDHCKSISLIGCGSENNIRCIKCDTSYNITFDCFNFLADYNNISNTIDGYILFKYCTNIIFNSVSNITNLPSNTKYLTYKHYMIPSGIIQISGITPKRVTFDHSDSPSINDCEFERKVVFYNVDYDTEENLTDYRKLPNSHTTVKSTSIFTIPWTSGSSVIKYIGGVNTYHYDSFKSKTIRFVGIDQDKTRIQFDSSSKITFEGYDKIIFENVRIQFSDNNAPILFKNTNVVFINCLIVGSPTGDYVFETENTNITFKNTVGIWDASKKGVTDEDIESYLEIVSISDWGILNDSLKIPYGTTIRLTDGTEAINRGIISVKLYTNRVVADTTAANTLFSSLNSYEKSKLIGSECFVIDNNSKLTWSGTAWVLMQQVQQYNHI